MKFIQGGITAPCGFRCNGIHCGIRKNKSKADLALIISEVTASAAAVYTQNKVKGAPIAVTKANLADGKAAAVICNSGNANTCNADGVEIAEKMCVLVEKHTGISANDVIVASTGVIGQKLDVTPIADGMEELVNGLGKKSDKAAEAIMTTDTRLKECAVEFTLGGKTCRIGGIAKGSGMINPNMATMLVFVTSDVSVSPDMLKKAVKSSADETFNMISVDGDTSTNDMLSVMANGLAGNPFIETENEDYYTFLTALNAVNAHLSRMIASDGEGATKLLECKVSGAKTLKDARLAAKGVISSSLLKAAMFGSDANWGRVLCALGYCGADLDVEKVGVSFISDGGEIEVCKDGHGVDFDEVLAKKILSEKEIVINVTLADGDCAATAWGCDLTYDYVKINGDYRT